MEFHSDSGGFTDNLWGFGDNSGVLGTIWAFWDDSGDLGDDLRDSGDNSEYFGGDPGVLWGQSGRFQGELEGQLRGFW